MLGIALPGCFLTPPMAPVQMPALPAQLNLCNAALALPPGNLASNPNYIEFAVDVIDSTGAPTIGLTQSDFVASENDRPIPVAYFHTEQGRPPVSIGILVDKSGSMVTKLPVVTTGVEALLSKLDPCDEVFLFAFGLDPILVEDFTTDHAIISQRLSLVGLRARRLSMTGCSRELRDSPAGTIRTRWRSFSRMTCRRSTTPARRFRGRT
jgi:VWFA-related protein